MVKDDDTVNDILQDTYIKAFARLDQLQNPERLIPWLKVIANNTAKDWLKKKKPILFSEMSNQEGMDGLSFVETRESTDIDVNPEMAADEKEVQRLVMEILDQRYYGDKSLSNANIVYANKIYTGKLYCRDDVDWYRFKLNGNNKLSLRFTIDDTVSNPEIWRIELIEYNSRKSLGRYDLDTNETLTVDKCSGDLIVKVWSGYGGAIGDIYHLQLATTPIISSSNTNVKPSTSSTKKPATVKKPSVTKITSIKAGKRKATVRWKKASNATGYYVYRATSPRGKYKKVATVTGRTYYTDKKSLKSRKNYYYKVVSIRKSGSKVLKSKASGYKRVKVK